MRHLLPLLGLLVACDDAPVCDASACGEICVRMDVPASGGGDDAILLPFEAEKMADVLDELRNTPRLVAARSGVCTGTSGCDRRLVDPEAPVPEGTWHVHADWQLTPYDTEHARRVTFQRTCRRPPDVYVTVPGRAIAHHEAFRLPEEGTSGTLDGLTFQSPDPDGPLDCAWSASLWTGTKEHRVEGRYRVEGLPPTKAEGILTPSPTDGAPPTPDAPEIPDTDAG